MSAVLFMFQNNKGLNMVLTTNETLLQYHIPKIVLNILSDVGEPVTCSYPIVICMICLNTAYENTAHGVAYVLLQLHTPIFAVDCPMHGVLLACYISSALANEVPQLCTKYISAYQ